MESDQQLVTIDKETFEADKEFIPLLKELDRIGLKTTQHCSGHNGKKDAYVTIELNMETDFWFRLIDGTPRLMIRWNKKGLYGGKR